MKWKYGLLLALMTLSTVRVSAQDDVEYRMEVGAAVGLMGYHGDFNGSLTKDLQPMGSLVARYIFNPYMGLKANVSYGMLKGSSADVKTWYPEYSKTPYSFFSSNGLSHNNTTCIFHYYSARITSNWRRFSFRLNTYNGTLTKIICTHCRAYSVKNKITISFTIPSPVDIIMIIFISRENKGMTTLSVISKIINGPL